MKRSRALPTASTQGALFGGCPQCGSATPPLIWATNPDTGARTYRCVACARRWTVEGVQTTLDLGACADAVLTLTVTLAGRTQ